MIELSLWHRFSLSAPEAIQFTTTGHYPSGCTNPMEWECESRGLDTYDMLELSFVIDPKELVKLVARAYDTTRNALEHISVLVDRGIIISASDKKDKAIEDIEFDSVELVATSSDLTEKHPPSFYVNLISVYEDCSYSNIEYGPWRIPEDIVKQGISEHKHTSTQPIMSDFASGYSSAVQDIINAIKESKVRDKTQIINIIKDHAKLVHR